MDELRAAGPIIHLTPPKLAPTIKSLQVGPSTLLFSFFTQHQNTVYKISSYFFPVKSYGEFLPLLFQTILFTIQFRPQTSYLKLSKGLRPDASHPFFPLTLRPFIRPSKFHLIPTGNDELYSSQHCQNGFFALTACSNCFSKDLLSASTAFNRFSVSLSC